MVFLNTWYACNVIVSALTELHDFDVIPDPKVVEAALRACRRVNDYSLTIRFLEAIKIKCGGQKNRDVVYGYIIQQVGKKSSQKDLNYTLKGYLAIVIITV